MQTGLHHEADWPSTWMDHNCQVLQCMRYAFNGDRHLLRYLHQQALFRPGHQVYPGATSSRAYQTCFSTRIRTFHEFQTCCACVIRILKTFHARGEHNDDRPKHTCHWYTSHEHNPTNQPCLNWRLWMFWCKLSHYHEVCATIHWCCLA